MKKVLITYKGSSRTRIVPQASVRATAIHLYHRKQKELIIEALGTVHRSPMTNRSRNEWGKKRRLESHCWKRSNKRANKAWQRHSNRTECRRRRSRSFGLQYYPSVRLLAKQGLCIYPAISR